MQKHIKSQVLLIAIICYIIGLNNLMISVRDFVKMEQNFGVI